MNAVNVDGKTRLLGSCKPDAHDKSRDFIMTASMPSQTEVTLRSNWKLAQRDQGRRGTCTDNGVLECAGYDFVRDGLSDPELSRLFLYYFTRKYEGTSPMVDSGASIHDTIITLRDVGAPLESLWPYYDDDRTFTLEPPKAVIEAAKAHKAVFFYRCPNLATILASIEQGFPVVFGFDCPDNFLSARCAATGEILMPAPGESFNGGHCMVFASFNQKTRKIGGPNSWGSWGDDGWFSMPFEMIEAGLVRDCWTLRKIKE